MAKQKIVRRKELLKKINEAKRKGRKIFLTEVNAYLEEARSVINDKSSKNKSGI